MPELNDFFSANSPAEKWLHSLMLAARDEDLGTHNVDATSLLLETEAPQAEAIITSRETGVLAGGALLPRLCSLWGGQVVAECLLQDGDRIHAGSQTAVLHGPLPEILKVERVALNFMGYLSGVASLTARYVDAVAGTQVRIMDTRKTLPGWRYLSKYAVACGGGDNHRMGLFDAVLIKDNHIAHLALDELANFVTRTASQARERFPDLKFVMVEVDTLAQLEEILPAEGLDLILLDNMPPDTLRQAVAMRNKLAPAVHLEASGGITLDTVQAVAASGVERISIGALTHSATNLDLGLDIA